MRASATACEQAREYISLALDGELAEVERARLDTHTAFCAACRAFQGDVDRIAYELRVAEPERPAYGVVLPRTRRFSSRTIQAGAAAAAVVAIVAAGSLFPNLGRETAPTAPLRLSQGSFFQPGDDVAPNLHPTKQRPPKRRVAV